MVCITMLKLKFVFKKQYSAGKLAERREEKG